MRSPTYSPRATPAFDWRPRLSVVLPTYNESGNIERLVQAVRDAAQAASELEIVVVDDDSPDGTAEIAASAGADVRVIVRKDASVTADDIRAHCRANLTGYKQPKYIEFRDSLPKTNVGKILRRELRDAKPAA